MVVMFAVGLMISIGKLFFLIDFNLGLLVIIGGVLESIGWVIIGNLYLLFVLVIGGSWVKDCVGGVFAVGIFFVLINCIIGVIFGVINEMLVDE